MIRPFSQSISFISFSSLAKNSTMNLLGFTASTCTIFDVCTHAFEVSAMFERLGSAGTGGRNRSCGQEKSQSDINPLAS